MTNKTEVAAGGGCGIGTVCLILFVVLKLVGIAPFVTWSWLKVILLPLLITIVTPFLIVAIFLIGAFIIALFAAIIAKIFS